jgi:tripartite-type tricarboxylate transporter receptor subunit TctC
MLTRRTLIATLIASPAIAQNKTLRVIVPYPAGGPTDAVGRIVAQELQLALGNTVIVENMPGGSGAIGTRAVVKAEADGMTLLLGNNQTLGSNVYMIKELGYDPLTDLTPIMGLADLQQAFIVKKDLPANNMAEFVAYAKREGDKVNYGSTGLGSGSHLAMELFKGIVGINPTHIPFRGAAQLAQELLAGRIDVSIATLASVLGQVEAGELKCLGIASLQSSPQLPKVLRLNEQGITGADSDSWLTLHAPAKTPVEIAAKYTALLNVALRKESVTQAMLKVGAVPSLREPAAFRVYHAAEIIKWGEVIKKAGVTPQ